MTEQKIPMILLIRSEDENATQELARAIAPLLRAGDTVRLEGTLGMGKTAFARALIRSFLGANEPVPSPTFALVQDYQTADFPLYHFDLYRLEEPDELFELGFEDAIASGVCLIEWSEKGAPHVPTDGLTVMFVPQPGDHEDVRLICMSAGAAFADRAESLAQIAEDRQQ